MGTIQADLFITLDGVYQAPGRRDEDPSGGFEFGGWQGAYADSGVGEAISAGIDRMDALLIGRRTYDIFAAYWPAQGESFPIAAKLNAVPKFVVSRTLADPAWNGTTVLREVEHVGALRDRFEEVHVIGSGELIHSLLRSNLVDRLNLFLYPLVLSSGKRLFQPGSVAPAAFRLARPAHTFSSGVTSLAFARADAPLTGIDIRELQHPRGDATSDMEGH